MVHRSAIQNLTVAVTGTAGAAAVISQPRSQVEMTDRDRQWQDRTHQGRAPGRARSHRQRRGRDRRGRSPAALRGSRGRTSAQAGLEGLRGLVLRAHRPTTLRMDDSGQRDDGGEGARRSETAFRSVLPLPSFGALRVPAQMERAHPVPADPRHLAMLTQWVSWAARRHFRQARTEALITLGSAPLDVPEFHAVVLGQLGEQRLDVAISAGLRVPPRTPGRWVPIPGAAPRYPSPRRQHRRRLPRPALAARVQGDRSLAAHRSAPELSQRLADPAHRPRCRPSPEDRRVRRERRLRPRFRRLAGWSLRAPVVRGAGRSRGGCVRVGGVPAHQGAERGAPGGGAARTSARSTARRDRRAACRTFAGCEPSV